MTKLRDALNIAASPERWQLDNLITHALGPEEPAERSICDYYIPSEADKRYDRFGLRRDVALINQKNQFIPGFSSLGENERYILNKIVFGKTPVTVIVGTVGAGKTTLCRYIQYALANVTLPGSTRPPLQIYVDLNKLRPDIAIKSTDDEEINEAFYDYFSSQLRYAISSICKTETEVGEIWDEALKDPPSRQLGPEFTRLVGTLRLRRIHSWNEKENGGLGYDELLSRRCSLREDLEKNKYQLCAYLCEMVSHVCRKYFSAVRWGVVLYIDNLDQISAHAQQLIRTTLLPLLRLADVRSIVMMRVSTWRMTKDEAYTFPVDNIPHSGPEPRKAVIARLESAKQIDPEEFGCHFEDPSRWKSHIEGLLPTMRPNSVVSECLSNLSGYSVRKAFTLAQYLLASIECPAEQEHLREHHLKRMMIAQGPPDSYQWSERSVVENIFQVHATGAHTPLLKLRIMRALEHANEAKPVPLGALVSLLVPFGYETNVIRMALNELMQPHKRLVWTDSVLNFPSDDTFQAGIRSKVYTSTVAKGYWRLAGDLDYMREVAMDTDVPDLLLSDTPRPGQPAPARLRLEALLRFMQWISRVDIREMKSFYVAQGGFSSYTGKFRSKKLLVADFLPSCLDQYERIVGALEGHGVSELKKSLEDLRNLIGIPLERIPEVSM